MFLCCVYTDYVVMFYDTMMHLECMYVCMYMFYQLLIKFIYIHVLRLLIFTPFCMSRSNVAADPSLLHSPVVHRLSSTSNGNTSISSSSYSNSNRVGTLLSEQTPSIDADQFRSVFDSSRRRVSNLTEAASPFIVSFQQS